MSNTALLGSYGAQDSSSLMFRNRIIGGCFRIWQRGTSLTGVTPSLGVSAYTADRWFVAQLTSQSATDVSQQTTGATKYAIRVQKRSGGTGASTNILGQVIENLNCFDLVNQAPTLTFTARAGADYSPTSSVLIVRISTSTSADQAGLSSAFVNGTATGQATLIVQNITLTTTNQKFTINAPQIASNVTNVCVTFAAVTSAAAAGANDWFEVSDVQLEAGPVATPFERRPIGTEIQLCQRYFEKSYNIDVAPGTSTSIGASIAVVGDSGSLNRLMPNTSCFAVPKRINATVSAYSETGTKDRVSVYSNSGSTLTVSSIPTAGNTRFGFIATTTNAVDRQMYYFHWTAEAEL